MTLRKQAVALLLAVLMLVSNIPVALATGDTTSPEFPDYTAQLYSKPFDQANYGQFGERWRSDFKIRYTLLCY